MRKRFSLSLPEDTSKWLFEQPDYSKAVDMCIRFYLSSRSLNTVEGIEQRMAEIKKEFEQLKLKQKELVEHG